MKVLVTGSKGFIGKNLTENLKNVKYNKDRSRSIVIEDVFEFDKDSDLNLLDKYCAECDFVFNLAGINRPQNVEEFNINHSFLVELLERLKKHNNKCPVMLSSSTHMENPKKRQRICF